MRTFFCLGKKGGEKLKSWGGDKKGKNGSPIKQSFFVLEGKKGSPKREMSFSVGSGIVS